MKLHILVEGESEAQFLRGWLGRLIPAHTFRVYPHQGKGKLPRLSDSKVDPGREGLLDQLPAKLRAFGKALNPATERVLVLIDLDDASCIELKERLVAVLHQCNPAPRTLFRIAIEETEAFFLGDRQALQATFPRAKLAKLSHYDQDGICGTWEVLQSVIGAKRPDKVEWAKKMARHLGTTWRGKDANASPSFRQFCRGILQLVGEIDG